MSAGMGQGGLPSECTQRQKQGAQERQFLYSPHPGDQQPSCQQRTRLLALVVLCAGCTEHPVSCQLFHVLLLSMKHQAWTPSPGCTRRVPVTDVPVHA